MEDRALTGLAGRYGFPVAVLLLFAWRFLHFGPEIDAPHDWRQCDTAWYIRDFYKNGVDLLHPAVCWMGARDTLALEFPLPEAVVAWFYRAFGESIPLARLTFLGFFAGAAAYFYRIAHFILGRPLARLATLVYLALPLSIFYSRAIHVDFSVVLLVHVAAYHFLAGIKHRRWPDMLLSSLAAALAAVIKAPYLFCVVPPLLFFAIREKAPGWMLRRAWLYALPAGAFLLWQRHVDALNGAAPDWNYLLHYRKMTSNASLHWYFGAPGQRLSLYSWSVLARRGVFEVAGPGGILFFLAGLYGIKKMPGSGMVIFWLLGGAAYTLLFFNLNVIHNYYQIPLLAPVAMLCAHGLQMASRGNLRALSLLTGLLVAVNLTWSEHAYYQIDPLQVEIGRVIRENTPDTALVIVTCGTMDCRDPRILYRAGRRGWSVEEKALRAEVVGRLHREEGAQYWVFIGENPPASMKAFVDHLPPPQTIGLPSEAGKVYIFKLPGSK